MLPLYVVEELLYRVKPGRVLGVEQHVCPELACCLINRGHLMDGSVVHQDDDVFTFCGRVNAQFVQYTV